MFDWAPNTPLQVVMENTPLLMENLHLDHKFLRRVAKTSLSVDNHLCITSQKLVEYVLKTS